MLVKNKEGDPKFVIILQTKYLFQKIAQLHHLRVKFLGLKGNIVTIVKFIKKKLLSKFNIN